MELRGMGIDVTIHTDPLGFSYGRGVSGPDPEMRRLDDIRSTLEQPDCQGPEQVYCIAMDVFEDADKEDLVNRNLLYGIVSYASGKLGREPIRSQGHIHAISPSCGMSTCEVYEIWSGEAIIYMQQSAGDDAGDCYAVRGRPGDVIIVPPGWVHATVNASPDKAMSFGAWCVRDYGFDYRDVRRHHGIAFFPHWEDGTLIWEMNRSYRSGKLIEKTARPQDAFGIRSGVPIYRQYKEERALFDFVPRPMLAKALWASFEP